MISYELVKELKDAGFPQEGDGRGSWDVPNTPEELVYYPTLEELIEACGEDFVALYRQVHARKEDSRWVATGKITKSKLTKWLGSTPAEAVAYLYLALNKKKV